MERISSENLIGMRSPVLVLGVGGLGSRLATKVAKRLECACMIVTDDKQCVMDGYPCVMIDTRSWVNPTSRKLRFYAQASEERIRSMIAGFKTILLIGNLAGKAGVALCPTICDIVKKSPGRSDSLNGTEYSSAQSRSPSPQGRSDMDLISFVIMPFRFEKDRIFESGISLKRIRESSGAVVVVDNDALLDNNPDLTISQCYAITNQAILDTISSMYMTEFSGDMHLLGAGRPDRDSLEDSAIDSLAMLLSSTDTNSVRRTLVSVIGGNGISAGTMNGLISAVQTIFKGDELSEVNLTMTNSGPPNVHLLASVIAKTKFDSYDPLSEIIPHNSNLDWDELECSPEFNLRLQSLD